MRNFVRFFLRLVFTILKVRCNIQFDPNKLPTKAVYISNHVSFLDPILLFAFLPGDPIFALNGHLYRSKWVRFFLRTADVMPFNPIEPADLKEMIAKISSGRRFVVFAEGRMTDNGGLMKIYEAPGLAADKSGALVVPVWINGPQFGYFSKTKGKLPHRPLPRIIITVKKPIKFKLKDNLRNLRDHLSNEVYMIMRDMCFDAINNGDISLFGMLMKAAKVNSKHRLFLRPKFFEDINRVPQSYCDLVVKSFVLGRFFKKMTSPQERVAVLLPNTLATVCTFFGLSAYERIPVMLNFSAGLKNILSMCNTAQVKLIVTSHTFIHGAKMENVISALREKGYKIFFLEDLRKKLTLKDKLAAYVRYKVKRVPHPVGGDKEAAVLFTSGSEGAPKAVVLSHANLISNVDQVSCVFTCDTTDVMLNVLPMFHSFGLTVGTLFPIFKGSKLFLYPSPLHYRVIAELSYEIGTTLLVGTDTFFRGYAKIAHPMDFSKLRIMVGGAEAIKPDTRNIWGERMGVSVKEGYGSTECAPVVCVNNHIFNRFGSIGKLLPKIQYKLNPVDGIEKGGELCVKGPNIMKGYIMPDNPGVLVPLKDGWYSTGDVVEIDEIGFVYIRDRIKRFAKVGGEMVSLNAVLETVIKAFEKDGEFDYGVVAVPHDTKGEQVVLVSNNKMADAERLHVYIKQNGLPELYLPRVVLYRDSLPTFATGKADNVTLKKQVMEELGL